MFDEVPYYGITDSKFPDTNIVQELYPYICKYISIKPELLQDANKIIQNWGDSIVGVHIRGTDMNYTPGHPVPPTIEMYMDAIDKVSASYKKIFLCTDEASILYALQKRYGERIVFSNAFRSDDGTSIHLGSAGKRAFHRYLTGREVLMDVLLLSKCNAIICGHSNVSYSAILLNANQYDFVHLLENPNQTQNT